MEIPAVLFQFVGSMLAIIALATLAWWLKLGPEPKLNSEAAAREAADQAVSGFVAVSVALDKQERGAILRDASGRLMLLRPHGSHFAGRLLSAQASMEIVDETLVIDSGERRFGTACLAIDDPKAWVDALDALDS